MCVCVGVCGWVGGWVQSGVVHVLLSNCLQTCSSFVIYTMIRCQLLLLEFFSERSYTKTCVCMFVCAFEKSLFKLARVLVGLKYIFFAGV